MEKKLELKFQKQVPVVQKPEIAQVANLDNDPFEEKTIDISHGASKFKKSQSDSNLLFNDMDIEEEEKGLNYKKNSD